MLRRWLRWMGAHKKHLGLSALSGLLYGLGYCAFEQQYLMWVAWVPILYALEDQGVSTRSAVLLAWVPGFIAHLMSYGWIVYMLRKFAYLPLPLAILGYALLCLGQSSLYGFWGWLYHRLRHQHGVAMMWAAPVTMVIAEWLYPALFPSYLANSQYRVLGFVQSLDVWGPLGLTFMLVVVSATLLRVAQSVLPSFDDLPTGEGDATVQPVVARARPPVPWLGATAVVVLLAGNYLYGQLRLADVKDTVDHAGPEIRVGLVQTNMGIYQKAADPAEGLRRHREQSLELERQGVDLILWPESGFTDIIVDGMRSVKHRVFGQIETPLLFGGLRLALHPKRMIYNTAFMADAQGQLLGSYDKVYLLAFGEYLPFGDVFPWLYKLSPHSSHFGRGTRLAPLELNGVKYGVLICYEDILPSFVRDVMAYEPDVLVNLTNDAWFGDSSEPAIHLALATFRAVEHRRYLARATNSGISAFVDPTGRIVSQTGLMTRANLVERIVPLKGRTVYAVLGNWVGALCLLVCLWWMRDWLRLRGSALAQRSLARLGRRPVGRR